MDVMASQSDVVIVSPTGSGKTLAYLLPCVLALDHSRTGIQLLVIVPSRELAIQTGQVLQGMRTGFKHSLCYGGHAVGIEENNLKEAPAVLIGTPGRISHHLRSGALNLESVTTLVLDEFDKSLEAGFDDEMAYILSACTGLQKRILTSATFAGTIPAFVGIKDPFLLDAARAEYAAGSAPVMKWVRVPGDDKLEALVLLLGKPDMLPAIVFCNHREAVERVSEQLNTYGIAHGIYHGGMEQINREKTLIRFRNGSMTLLIATDLAARGLDIPEIQSVIHYQLPLTEDSLVHRNGRTARMHAGGSVYYLLDHNDQLPQWHHLAPEEELLPRNLVMPPAAIWTTLYISAGKKDKINKADIVGVLIQKGKLTKDEIGRIDVLDHSAYVAVLAARAEKALRLVANEKLKNKRVRIQRAN